MDCLLAVQEMSWCFADARDDPHTGVIVLTGVVPLHVPHPVACCEQAPPGSMCHSAGAGQEAFCSGGDQSVRGRGGYVGEDEIPRLNVLDLQVLWGWGSQCCLHLASALPNRRWPFNCNVDPDQALPKACGGHGGRLCCRWRSYSAHDL